MAKPKPDPEYVWIVGHRACRRYEIARLTPHAVTYWDGKFQRKYPLRSGELRPQITVHFSEEEALARLVARVRTRIDELSRDLVILREIVDNPQVTVIGREDAIPAPTPQESSTHGPSQ